MVTSGKMNRQDAKDAKFLNGGVSFDDRGMAESITLKLGALGVLAVHLCLSVFHS